MILNTYQITACCYSRLTATFDVQAATPADALEIAKEQVLDEPAEDCGFDYPWDMFTVCAGEDELLTYRPPRDETKRLRLAASALLDALKVAEGFVQWAADHGADQAATASALAVMRSAIAGGEALPSIAQSGLPGTPAMRLLTVLKAILPYAENESHSLYESWRRDGDDQVKEYSDTCAAAIGQAHAAIVEAESAPASQTRAAELPAGFEIEPGAAYYKDRVHLAVDQKFDVTIIRTDEGIVVDVYPKGGLEPIASTYAFDSDAVEQPA